MPNLLAHCGVQGALTHALIKDAPPAWITIRMENIHLHWPWFRDGSSYIGRMWLGVLGLTSWWQPRLPAGHHTEDHQA
jgi:hypothetical protein